MRLIIIINYKIKYNSLKKMMKLLMMKLIILIRIIHQLNNKFKIILRILLFRII